ncbi:hypothetical protein ACFLUQ_00055 [Chloroflexota bacterium]
MPKELLRDGFSGSVDVFSTSITFTIVHPNADLKTAKESLAVTLKDIELRLKNKNSDTLGTESRSQKNNRTKRKAQ